MDHGGVTMCYLCDEDSELFDYACCEECGEPICYDAPREGIEAKDGTTAKGLMDGEQIGPLRQAKKYKHGHFCVQCFEQFTAEMN